MAMVTALSATFPIAGFAIVVYISVPLSPLPAASIARSTLVFWLSLGFFFAPC